MSPPQCRASECDRPADTAIKSSLSKRYGLTHTIYHLIEEAPASATPYCVDCGMSLVRELVRITNPNGATT